MFIQFKMEEHIVKMIEIEGLYALFPDREKIWMLAKTPECLSSICQSFVKQYHDIQKKAKKRADQALHIQIEWRKSVVKYARESSHFEVMHGTVESFSYHRDCIMQAIGKHCFSYLQNTVGCNEINKKKSNKVTKNIKQQDTVGLQVLAGGCLGQMFRLFKTNRKKYGIQLKLLSHIIVVDKKDIPVQQRCIDRGKLYAIKPHFIHVLKQLDAIIKVELQNRLGDAFSQVSILFPDIYLRNLRNP